MKLRKGRDWGLASCLQGPPCFWDAWSLWRKVVSVLDSWSDPFNFLRRSVSVLFRLLKVLPEISMQLLGAVAHTPGGVWIHG
jgi:hypothetical protein